MHKRRASMTCVIALLILVVGAYTVEAICQLKSGQQNGAIFTLVLEDSVSLLVLDTMTFAFEGTLTIVDFKDKLKNIVADRCALLDRVNANKAVEKKDVTADIK